MEVERTQDLIKSEEGKSLSEIDILQYWTQNVANIDYAVIIENSALLGSSNDYNKALMHFARCSDSKCASSSCQWMKGLILHSHECEQKSKGQCHDCQKAVAICILHSTKCEESNCPIHFCFNVKN
eukprot:12379.XXX_191838_192268_1 [CDS] Oithona nana genome sequencing.